MAITVDVDHDYPGVGRPVDPNASLALSRQVAGMIEELRRLTADGIRCDRDRNGRLPGMGRLALPQQLRDAGDTMPVTIVITGSSNVSMTVQAMKAGASDFIEKPARQLPGHC